MTNLRDKIDQFEKKHPILMWLLVRFVMCAVCCAGAFLMYAGALLLFVPSVLIKDFGAGLGAFAWWLLEPAIVFVIVVLISVFTYVWEEWR